MAYNTIWDLVIPIMAVVGLSAGCAMFTRMGETRYSMNVFLTGVSIGISFLVWKGILEFWVIIFSILPIVAMLFFTGGDDS